MEYPKNLLKPIWDLLKNLESDLTKRRKALKAEDPFIDQTRLNDNADLESEAAEQYGHEQSTAMSEQTNSSLKRVRDAIARIDAGTYGACVKCGKMIDTDRLGVDPTAELCIVCAKADK